MKAERRQASRKEIEPIIISSITSLDSFATLAREGIITDASSTGFLMMINRRDLVPKYLKENLTLDALVGDRVMIHLPQLNIEIAGRVARTRLLGKKGFEIALDYTDDAPEYWRECLLDLLPQPGEMD